MYDACVASDAHKESAVGLPEVVTSAPVITASLQQLPVDSLPLEADKAESCIQPAASGQQTGSTSAPYQATEQVDSLARPISQAFRTPSPPPQSHAVLFAKAADALSAKMNMSAMPSCPVMPTAARAATAGEPASDATSAAVPALPAYLPALEPAGVGPDSVRTAAVLLPEMPSSAAARLPESLQVQFTAAPQPLAVAEQLLQNGPMTLAPVSVPLLATDLLDPATATPPLQRPQQGNSFAAASRLLLRPASSAGTAVASCAVPALPSPKDTVVPSIPSAATANQQAAAEEAASGTHMAPPVTCQPSSAPVLQQQHGDAAVHCQHGGVAYADQQQEVVPAQQRGGRGQEGLGDLLYEHLAAVLATVPAVRDCGLTFAPLHGQMHCPGTDKPSSDAGYSL